MTHPLDTESPPVMMYSTEDVRRAAAFLAGRPTGDRAKRRERLASFKFRHESGSWWYCSPPGQTWHRHVQGKWLPAGPPGGGLLGPVWVADLLEFEADGPVDIDGPLEQDIPDQPDVAGDERLQTMAMAVAGVQDRFAAGELNSAAAEAILRKFYLLDERWRLWTVGVRSGRWFELTETGWQARDAGPQTSPPSDSPDYLEGILKAQGPILGGAAPAIPEPVAPDWCPPDGFPPPPADAPPPEHRAPAAPPASKPDHAADTAPRSTAATTPTVQPPTAGPDAALDRPRKRKLGRWIVAALALAAVAAVAISLIVHSLRPEPPDLRDPDAMYELGQNYRTDQGFLKDPEMARYWLGEAADKEHAGALFALGMIYGNGEDVEIDYPRARQFFERAAENGHRNAMAALAQMYEQGLGGQPDRRQAEYWRNRAAQQP